MSGEMQGDRRLCAAGDRCRNYDPANKQPAEARRSPLCDTCIDHAERDIRALVLDYRDLENWLPQPLGVWGDGRAGFNHPIPLRQHIDTLQRDIHWITTAWEEVIRDVDQLSERRTNVRAGYAVQTAVTILSPRLALLASLEATDVWDYPIAHCPRCGRGGNTNRDPDGVKRARCANCKMGWRQPDATTVTGLQAITDLQALHGRARHALGLTTAEPELCIGVPCKSLDCDTTGALYREPGADSIKCGACGRWYSAEDYADWIKRWAVSDTVKTRLEGAA